MVCFASTGSVVLVSEDADCVPYASIPKLVQSSESPQDDGDTYDLRRSLYVHGLCLEAAEP